MAAFLVYTDGSCSAKDRVGGYAYQILFDDLEVLDGGYEYDTTISRMELMAAIEALEYLEGEGPNTVILLLSDSEYVVKGFMDKQRKRTKNVDLWLELEERAKEFGLVVFEHVKGHSGVSGNENVDKLAGEFRQAALNDSTASRT